MAITTVLLVGCAGPLLTARPSPAQSGEEEAWQVCEADAFSVAYPSGWFVHPPDEALGVVPCTLFAATEFGGEIEHDGGWAGAQVVLGLGEGCRGSFEVAVTTEDVVVDGMPAFRHELAAGEGPEAPEPRAVEYFVNLTPNPPCETSRWFYARTESDDPGEYGLNRRILDEMMSSLRWAD